jgi:hypothetical protein
VKLGDRIKLHYEREQMFGDGKPKIVDGEFTIIGVSYGLPHCFSEDLWSPGFNHFDYGEHQDEQPDIVLRGSIYVPTPDYLDKTVVDDLHYDKKAVSWEVLQ